MKTFAAAIVAASLVATSAGASLLQFQNQGGFSTTFSDGTLSRNISAGAVSDGWTGLDPFEAINTGGQSGEFVTWNAPTIFDAVRIYSCYYCKYTGPVSIRISLYDALGNLLKSRVATPIGNRWGSGTMNTPGVSKAVFTFADPARTEESFFVDKITYGDIPAAGFPTPVPEPGAWALMLLGVAGSGLAMRRNFARAGAA